MASQRSTRAVDVLFFRASPQVWFPVGPAKKKKTEEEETENEDEDGEEEDAARHGLAELARREQEAVKRIQYQAHPDARDAARLAPRATNFHSTC